MMIKFVKILKLFYNLCELLEDLHNVVTRKSFYFYSLYITLYCDYPLDGARPFSV